MSQPGFLCVDEVAVSRGGRVVLRGVSFDLGPGEAVRVTGPNGAGKSTLLRALAGLLPLAAGKVNWGEAGEREEAQAAAERTHYLGHVSGLKGALTAAENLRFAAALAGAGVGTPGMALERLGLGPVADLPLAYLSSGQRRRVALARLLVAWRPLWLLDEPATALDGDARATLDAMLTQHLARGGCIVAATHARLDLGAARELRIEPA